MSDVGNIARLAFNASTPVLYAERADAMRSSVAVNSFCRARKPWFAFRSGYDSASAKIRPECAAQGSFGRARRCGPRRGHGGVACSDDGFEGLGLVLGVALDGLDEVGDQIVPPSELHVDLRPVVVDRRRERDEAVVRRDRPHHGDGCGDHDCDECEGHAVLPRTEGRSVHPQN